MDVSLQSKAEQLAAEFAAQATTIEDLNQLMRLMMKSGLERMLDTEMDVHLGRRAAPAAVAQGETAAPPPEAARRSPNRRNGHSRKAVQGDLGEVVVQTPR